MMFLVIILAAVLSATSAYRFGGLLGRTISVTLGRKSSPVARSSLWGRKLALPMSSDEDLHKAMKSGLEVGLFKAMKNKDGPVKPKELLKKYGAAYLVTSITLAIISYGTCYALVSAGIDVSSLLGKIGIEVTGTSSNVGTAGIAYIIHKAASPIRFPPTVALTPVVANLIGKKIDDSDSEEQVKESE